MISNHDRSGWIGASDTAMVMGNWDTETFRRWWATKSESVGIVSRRLQCGLGQRMSIKSWTQSALRLGTGRYGAEICASE